LIRAHLAEDNLVEAVKAFEAYRSVLWDSLGYRPSRALTDLVFTRANSGAARRVGRTT
jgi:hypothetical protein